MVHRHRHEPDHYGMNQIRAVGHPADGVENRCRQNRVNVTYKIKHTSITVKIGLHTIFTSMSGSTRYDHPS